MTRRTLPVFTEHLSRSGLANTAHTFGGDTTRYGRKIGQLVAAKYPLFGSAGLFATPWPESVLTARVSAPDGVMSVHSTHIPHGSGHDWVKIETLEAIYRGLLSEPRTEPVLLCDDFNAPHSETADGETITWAQRVLHDGTARIRGRMRGGTGAQWDAGERNVIRCLERHAFVDAFRTCHGFGVQEFSWYSNNRGQRAGRRFDHVFVSNELTVVACSYVHEVRERNLSDHSALTVTVRAAETAQSNSA